MSMGSPMAAKTAKARKMDMLEMRYIQSRGDAADYLRGRITLPYCREHLSNGAARYAVYYADGRRHVCADLTVARRRFLDEDDAVKMWDGKASVRGLI